MQLHRQVFKYDTSSAHTLAALVKKLSGLGILDYLRTLYLDALGFSADAYILKDPFGDEIGGSGLLARPRDLLLTGRFLLALYNGTDEETYPADTFGGSPAGDPAFRSRYREFIRQCMRYQTSTVHEGKTLDECQGYGWQFWMVRGGIAMYGMGGVPQNIIESSAENVLQDQNQYRRLEEQCEDNAAIARVREEITLQNKKISMEKFRELK